MLLRIKAMLSRKSLCSRRLIIKIIRHRWFCCCSGKHITVRYIHFTGNNVTEDQTLRNELTFMEGSPYAQSFAESKAVFTTYLSWACG